MGDRIGGMATRMQDGAKNATSSLLLFLLKLISGLVLGLTLGLIIREILQNGFLTLLFVLLTTTVVFMKLSSNWSYGQVFIFDLVCILVGMLLRVYIVVAP